MKIRYPHPLPQNGTIAITAPASPVDQSKLNRGVEYLNQCGYRVEVGKSCQQREHYVAGSDRSRAEELMRFFRNSDIDAILCARGGYGSMRILPYLDFQQIRQHAKLLIGFSDITALQWAIFQKSRLVTLSAGMAATDMGSDNVNSNFEQTFWEFINNGEATYDIEYSGSGDQKVYGTALPGTLSVGLRLLGTSYFPGKESYIPILEDVNEPAHKFEGHLWQLKMASFFDQVPAVLFGHITPSEFEEYDEVPSHRQIISYIFEDLTMPVITGLHYGHIPNKIPLPVGAPISLYLGTQSKLTVEDIFNRT